MNNIIRWGLRHNYRGFGFIVKSFYRKGRIIIKTKYGSKFYANPYEKIDSAIIRFGYFDEDVYAALRENVSENATFWDIGSNIGLHAITLKRNFPDLNCVAFEPYPQAAEAFLQNCRLNDLDIPLYTFAVGGETDIKTLHSMPFNMGATRFAELKSSESIPTSLNVAVFSVDHLIDSLLIEQPDVLKIDTEGNEYPILKGAAGLLGSGKCRCIVFEANRDIDRIMELLRSYSYQVERLGEAPNFLAKLA